MATTRIMPLHIGEGRTESQAVSTRAVRRLNDTICVENGYSIVEDPKPYSCTADPHHQLR